MNVGWDRGSWDRVSPGTWQSCALVRVMHGDPLPTTPLEAVFWYWVYASVPAALLASALVYRFFGGDRDPIRCLWVISMPWCTMPLAMAIGVIESYPRSDSPGDWWDHLILLIVLPFIILLIVPCVLIVAGYIGWLGKTWGLRWWIAAGVSLIGETALAVGMTHAEYL